MKKQELNDQELQKTAGGWYGSPDDVLVRRYCPQHGKVLVKKPEKTCPQCGSPLTDHPE